MSKPTEGYREGSLEAPTRHPINWKNPDFYDESALFQELERAFDICHGCRRCVSLCNSFPTLFDLVDNSETMEVDGVNKSDYWNVVDHCYLCDLCYMTKCPYVPPHPWNLDFPHLMLRAKAVGYEQGRATIRDKILTSTQVVGKIAGIPVVNGIVNTTLKSKPVRKLVDQHFGVHQDAPLPSFSPKSFCQQHQSRLASGKAPQATETTKGKVALFVTCYGNRNDTQLVEDFLSILEHNQIPVQIIPQEACCGMPKLELGDLKAVEKYKNTNIPLLIKCVQEGWDILAPIPSCVLMFKSELPLLFTDDTDVQLVKNAFFDPFEYLMLRHKAGLLNTDFKRSLGVVAYHAACHQRVQNIGAKTREIFELIPDTTIQTIERCSGHDGTYAVKSEFYAVARKICQPVVDRVEAAKANHYMSDCPMAGHQIENGLNNPREPATPFGLLKLAYGL